jgi:small subunit ribosomal protein S6
MPGKRVYNYECMFLFGQAAGANLQDAVDHVKELVNRSHGELLALRKFDDRKLAYEVKGQKRGLYLLGYFKAPNDSMSHFERDCNLSEKLLRTMTLRCDHLTDEEIAAQDGRKDLDAEIKLRGQGGTPAPTAGSAAAPAAAPADANA